MRTFGVVLIMLFLIVFGCTSPYKQVTSTNQTPAQNQNIIKEAAAKPSITEQIKNPTSTCNDSDGKNIYVTGDVFVNDKYVTESCLDSKTVNEYYCQNGQLQLEAIACPSGYSCFLGKCTPNSTNDCMDSDNGDNIYVAGSVIYGGQNYSDVCTSPKNIREYSCVNNKLVSSVYECPSGYYCGNGSCNKFQQTCVSNNTSLNTSLKGTVRVDYGTGFPGIYTDTCSNDTVLTQYYCNGTSQASQQINCPCLDGACRSDVVCRDSDGITREIAGYVSIHPIGDNASVVYNYDTCIDSTKVLEYYCDGNEVRSIALPCSSTSPNSYCSAGRCVVN